MTIHEDITHLPAFEKSVVTFGSFDGVHLGHRAIFSRMTALAASIGGETVVVTFHPHPRLVIYPGDDSLRLLSTREEKINLFAHTGIDHLVLAPFSIDFAQLTPDDYIEKFIIRKFHPHTIVIGYDHRFGLDRQGSIEDLLKPRWRSHFQVQEIIQQLVDDNKISSTQIRRHLQAGQIRMANLLLGHPYIMTGSVIRGQSVGSTLGYPTANIKPSHHTKLVPQAGIYAAKIWIGKRCLDGMLYIGHRPTLDDGHGLSIEINIFDFDEDIYGQEVTLEFHAYIRDDKAFSNVLELTDQLARDEDAARMALQPYRSPRHAR